MPEVNIEGVTGFLSEVGNVDALTKNVLKVLEDPDLHAQLKENAIKHAATFDIVHVLPKYLALYNAVLNARK